MAIFQMISDLVPARKIQLGLSGAVATFPVLEYAVDRRGMDLWPQTGVDHFSEVACPLFSGMKLCHESKMMGNFWGYRGCSVQARVKRGAF